MSELLAVDEPEVRGEHQRPRRLVVDLLRQIDGLTVPEPKGAFYAYPSVEGVLGRTIRGTTPQTSAELAALILEEVEVAVVPGEAFGPSGFLRLSYALRRRGKHRCSAAGAARPLRWRRLPRSGPARPGLVRTARRSRAGGAGGVWGSSPGGSGRTGSRPELCEAGPRALRASRFLM